MRRIVNYEVKERESTSCKGMENLYIQHQNHDRVVDEMLKAMWIPDEMPAEEYKKSWCYFIYDRHTGEDVAEYKNKEEATDNAKLYGPQYGVRCWEPSEDELSQSDFEMRSAKRYASGHGA